MTKKKNQKQSYTAKKLLKMEKSVVHKMHKPKPMKIVFPKIAVIIAALVVLGTIVYFMATSGSNDYNEKMKFIGLRQSVKNTQHDLAAELPASSDWEVDSNCSYRAGVGLQPGGWSCVSYASALIKSETFASIDIQVSTITKRARESIGDFRYLDQYSVQNFPEKIKNDGYLLVRLNHIKYEADCSLGFVVRNIDEDLQKADLQVRIKCSDSAEKSWYQNTELYGQGLPGVDAWKTIKD